MDWINYHHLLYFWVTAREGSITRASEKLDLAQPTVSGQIQSLEKAIGEKLFLRQGRRLVLTETGKLVQHYADKIFTVGQELADTLRKRPTNGRQRLTVGVADGIPKLVAYRLLAPVIETGEFQLTCREGSASQLTELLAEFELDLVIADTPSADDRFETSHHRLGDSPVGLYGVPGLIDDDGLRFPESLDGAPLLLPSRGWALRRAIDGWLESKNVHPTIVAEFDDSALMKTVGQRGAGLFPAPTCIQSELVTQGDARFVHELDGLRVSFHALTTERQVKHPAVQTIIDGGQQRLARLLEIEV